MKKVIQIYYMSEEERKKRSDWSDGFKYILEDGSEVYTMSTDFIANQVIKNSTNKEMKQLKSHDFPEVYKWLGIDLNKLGCIMLDLVPLNDMLTVDHDGTEGLYYTKHKDRFWINGWVVGEVPHITLLYGLLETGKNFEPYINKVLENWELDEVEIENISYFDSPYEDDQYYCLIAHIKVTPELMEGHQRLEFLPHINTFAGYKPHMTIAYIRKDEALRDKLISRYNDLWKGKKLKVKTGINLGGKK